LPIFEGNLLLEDIQPLEQLGSGASATVRLARHKKTGRLLALKIINVVAERERRRQIVNEIKVLCSMVHPQLVPMFDAFYCDGYCHIALRYMDGGVPPPSRASCMRSSLHASLIAT
jgi:serine/threonine protein kinase